MPGTLSAKFKEEMARSHIEPVVQVAITLTSPDTRQVALSSAESADYFAGTGILADPIIISVTDVSQEIDPIKRAYQVSTLQIEILNDPKIRSLMTSHVWFDAVALVTIGTVSMISSTDYETIFYGRVERAYADYDKITLDITTRSSKLNGYKTRKTFSAIHPLEVLKTVMNDAGIEDAALDTATFASTNFADISHHCFTSFGYSVYQDMSTDENDNVIQTTGDVLEMQYNTRIVNGIGNIDSSFKYGQVLNIFAEDFAHEYCELAGLTLVNDTASKIKAVLPDPSAAVTKHLTVDDYYNFKQDPEALLFNQIELKFGTGSNAEDMAFKDATSIAKFGKKIYAKKIVYFAPAGLPVATQDSIGVTATTATLTAYGINGFCGTRNLKSGQVAADQIDAGNPFFGFWRSGIYTTTTAHTDPIPLWDAREFQISDENGDYDGNVYNHCAQIKINGMSVAGGETYTNSNGGFFYDITIGKQFADRILTRFSNGAPKISFTLGLEHMDLELSDVISIDNNWFVYPQLNLDGLDNNVKFEITKKEVRPCGPDVGIDFEAVYLTHSSAPSVTTGIIAPPTDKLLPLKPTFPANLMAQATTSNAIHSGFEVSHSSGLAVTVGKGLALMGNKSRQSETEISLTLDANKDNYIALDLGTGIYKVLAQSASDAEPIVGQTEILLGKVVTDGSTVTSLLDLRSFGAITPRQLNRTLFQPGDGVLWNGGFEQWDSRGFDPTGWGQISSGSAVINTDYQRDDTVAHSGKYCLQLNNTATAIALYSDYIRIDNTKPYRVSLWVREKANFNQRVDLNWYTATKEAASTSSAAITNASCAALNTWENRSVIVTPGSDVAYARIILKRPTSPGGDCFFDDVTIRAEKPSFKAYGAATTSLTIKALNKIELNNEEHDYGSNYDHSSNYRFTAPYAGTYCFDASAYLIVIGSFSYIFGTIKKNGSTELAKLFGWQPTTNVAVVNVNTGSVYLEKGDYVEFFVHPEVQTSATVSTTQSLTWFAGRQVS